MIFSAENLFVAIACPFLGPAGKPEL